MKKNLLKIVLILFLLPEITIGQIIDCPYFSLGGGNTLINYPNKVAGNLEEVVKGLLENIIYFIKECLVKPALIIVIIMSGIYIMTSVGNPGKVEMGKKILLAGVIGLIIIFGAATIRDLFEKYLK